MLELNNILNELYLLVEVECEVIKRIQNTKNDFELEDILDSYDSEDILCYLSEDDIVRYVCDNYSLSDVVEFIY